jgi:NADPH2:quinone reductase
MIGGQYALDSVKSLKWNGRFVVVGFASGNIPNIPANRLLLKNASVIGLYWGELAYREPKSIKKDFLKLEELYKKNLLKPNNHKTFKLENASEALHYLLERKNIGKIVLKVN